MDVTMPVLKPIAANDPHPFGRDVVGIIAIGVPTLTTHCREKCRENLFGGGEGTASRQRVVRSVALIVQGGHHLLRQPDVFILVAHFNARVRASTGCHKRQILRGRRPNKCVFNLRSGAFIALWFRCIHRVITLRISCSNLRDNGLIRASQTSS